MVGQHNYTIDCESPLSYQSIQHILLGNITGGTWCTFVNFHHLTKVKMNLLQYFMSVVSQSFVEFSQQQDVGGGDGGGGGDVDGEAMVVTGGGAEKFTFNVEGFLNVN